MCHPSLMCLLCGPGMVVWKALCKRDSVAWSSSKVNKSVKFGSTARHRIGRLCFSWVLPGVVQSWIEWRCAFGSSGAAPLEFSQRAGRRWGGARRVTKGGIDALWQSFSACATAVCSNKLYLRLASFDGKYDEVLAHLEPVCQ